MAGGASIIDVKEPSRGALGRSDACVWEAVRVAVPRSMPLSVALGELNEWLGSAPPQIHASAWAGIDFCKLGLAVPPADWRQHWGEVRNELQSRATPFPAWVAVVYLDWKAARAPHPDAIIDAAAELPEIRAVLFDTWRKSSGALLDRRWKPLVERAQNQGDSSHLPARWIPQRLHDGKPGGPTSTPSEARPVPRAIVLAPIDTARAAQLVDAVGCGRKTAAPRSCRRRLKSQTAPPGPAAIRP